MSSTNGTRPRHGAQRKDARSNDDMALRAVAGCLAERPGASIEDIAEAASVDRVTLYFHYGSRERLIEATLEQALRDGEVMLARVDLTDPVAGLEPLIGTSWQLMTQAGGLLEAAREALTDQRVRAIHADAETRVLDLIERAQLQGHVRTDLPARWLAGVLHHVMKGAAADVAAGRIAQADASHLIHDVVSRAYAIHE